MPPTPLMILSSLHTSAEVNVGIRIMPDQISSLDRSSLAFQRYCRQIGNIYFIYIQSNTHRNSVLEFQGVDRDNLSCSDLSVPQNNEPKGHQNSQIVRHAVRRHLGHRVIHREHAQYRRNSYWPATRFVGPRQETSSLQRSPKGNLPPIISKTLPRRRIHHGEQRN